VTPFWIFDFGLAEKTETPIETRKSHILDCRTFGFAWRNNQKQR
jgi:hypothetical protein